MDWLLMFDLELRFWMELTFIIGSDESEDVVMPQHDCLVNLSFSEPRSLLPRTEDFNRDVFSTPTTTPDLTESTLTDRLH